MEQRILTRENLEALELIAKRLPDQKVMPNPKNLVSEKIKPKQGSRKNGGIIRVPKSSEGIPIYSMMLGEAMIQNNITLENNEKIIPHKKYYLISGYVMVNHLDNLKKAYLMGGSMKVSEYVNKVKEATS